MHTMNRVLGLLAVSALVGSTTLSAEARSHRDAPCGGASFSTCAAVHLSTVGSRVAIETRGHGNDWAGAKAPELIEIRPAVDRFGPDGRDGVGGSIGSCPVPSGNPLDCPVNISVTPEPLSMTLLATGLAGMSGVGLFRRKRKASPAV